MNKIALSVDLDDLQHVRNSFRDLNYNYRNDELLKGRYDYITEPTKRLLKYFKEFNIHATFFIIADMVDMYPELVAILKDSDHEIAHHSLSHFVPLQRENKNIKQSPEDWEKDLVEAKVVIENAFEKEVIGYRAPSAYFADWMIAI